MITDYLSAEAAIITRIKTALVNTNVRAVLSAADLAGVEEKSQTAPAVHVLYDGDLVPGGAGAQAGRGAAQVVTQRWLVVLVVRNARDATGNAARGDAGPIISTLLTALQGFQPTADHRELTRTNAPRPLYRRSGLAYFPLAFETRLIAA